jgi:hypothetical protein
MRFLIGIFSSIVLPLAVAAQTNSQPGTVELPIKLRHGDLFVETSINKSRPLSFKLDTGFGVTTLHPDLVSELNLRHNGHLTIVGIAGEEQAETYGGASFDFHGLSYEPRRVAVLPSESRRRGRHRDGILGAGFFRGFVVEIDFATQQMRLYAPAEFNYTGKGEAIPLSFKSDTPIVDAVLVPVGHAPIAGRFEIDTGCDDGICLGHDFVAANHLGKTNSEAAGIKRGVGGAAQFQQGDVAELRLGGFTAKKPSTTFFMEGSPAGEGQAGHIGLGSLEQFRVIFDYSRKRMILEPRS